MNKSIPYVGLYCGDRMGGGLKADCLNDADRLRRYHVLTMAGVQRSYQRRCRSKASRIAIAQGLLLASAIILVFALADFVVP
jgi:hypothetical protein